MPSARKAAAICYRLTEATEPEFLLVRNRAGTQWVFPKGTVEAWEAFGYQGAAREAWEEAGARGEMDPQRLGIFRHTAKLKKTNGWQFQRVEAYLLRVTDTTGTPEPGRQPTWFSWEAAHTALRGKPGIPAEEGEAAHMLVLACEWLTASPPRMPSVSDQAEIYSA